MQEVALLVELAHLEELALLTEPMPPATVVVTEAAFASTDTVVLLP